MLSLHLVLLLLSCVSFGLSALNVPSVNWIGLGLFLFSLTWFV